MSLILFLPLLLLFFATFQARPALAHALLERSDPAAGAVLSSAPAQVHLYFSEDLNASASKIVVWDRYRHDREVGRAQVPSGHSRELVAPLHHLTAGSYLVLWTSVSADDGHVLRGSFVFSVKHTGPLPSLAGVSTGTSGQTFPDTETLLSIVAHWLELLAAITWVGAEVFTLFIPLPRFASVPSADSRRRKLVFATLILLLLSSAGVLLLLAYNLGSGWSGLLARSTWSGLFSSEYGHLWLARQALVLITLLAMISASSPRQGPESEQRWWRRDEWSIVVLGFIYLYLFAGSGHAASSAIASLAESHLASGSVVVDWFHFIADALWLGGQIYIATVLIPTLRPFHSRQPILAFLEILARFSPIAYISIALYTVSGVFNAKIHIPSWYAFFNSVYGKTLIIKILLIGLMMAVSALTVYVLRPRIRQALPGSESAIPDGAQVMIGALQSWLRVNPFLGAGVLLATSVLFYYPVPFGFSPPGQTAYIARSAGLIAKISVTPDRSGINRIHVVLTSDTGRPVQAHVTVLNTMLDMPMGTSLAPLTETSTGKFSGNTTLSMGGHWRLQLLIYRPSGLSRMSVTVMVGT
ncbi:MAG: copper resistance protein CopC [Chloroflexota bacterium]